MVVLLPQLWIFFYSFGAFGKTVTLYNLKDLCFQAKIQKPLGLADNPLDLSNPQYLPVWKTELNIKYP